MKYTHRALAIALVSLVALIGAGVYFRNSFNLIEKCNKQVVSEQYSPSRAYVIQNTLANCGATSDYATQMVARNVNSGREEIVLSLKGNYTEQCNMNWDNDISVKLTCSGEVDKIYNQRKKFESIQISFFANGVLNEEEVISN